MAETDFTIIVDNNCIGRQQEMETHTHTKAQVPLHVLSLLLLYCDDVISLYYDCRYMMMSLSV